MSMKDIEQQIRDKRDTLDIESPPPDLWTNIRDEWKKDQAPKPGFGWWKVAAIIFLGSSIALLAYSLSLKEQVNELASLGDISEEYRIMENNYQQEIGSLTSSIPLEELMTSEDYSWVGEELKMLEEINKEYRKDIGQDADQELLVEALIDYYEKKIRLLKKLELEIKRRQNEESITTTDAIS